MQVLRFEVLVLTGALTAAIGAPALGQPTEPPDDLAPESESGARQAAEENRPGGTEFEKGTPSPAQGASPPGAVPLDFELFVRPGWHGLQVAAVDTATASAGDLAISDSVQGSRYSSSFGGGAGARVFRGRFGVEAGWHRFRNRDLVPLAVNEDADAFDEFFEAPFAINDTARADLFLGQLVFRWPARAANLSLSLGAGGGYLRVNDPVTEALDRTIQAAIPDDFSSFLETSVTADRSALLLGGSAGVSIRAGRLLLRPRLDVFFGRSLIREVDLRFTPGPDELLPPGTTVAVGVSSSITPRFVLIAVDIGFVSR